jgi:hypothetical protein
MASKQASGTAGGGGAPAATRSSSLESQPTTSDAGVKQPRISVLLTLEYLIDEEFGPGLAKSLASRMFESLQKAGIDKVEELRKHSRNITFVDSKYRSAGALGDVEPPLNQSALGKFYTWAPTIHNMYAPITVQG